MVQKHRQTLLMAFALSLNGLTFGVAKYCLTLRFYVYSDVLLIKDRPKNLSSRPKAAFFAAVVERPLDAERDANVCGALCV
ncbi:hypothetical protein [Granulicella sp. S156]|jgi:hypothetical protein|uniref:hypothetical protein n=1 Tax=Granulicella sp. S156 TaxID=1747224 RepID=UPI00131D4D79|nr:hypothetical protein [Granulicella sp. S156]